jgi:hypothetical protein
VARVEQDVDVALAAIAAGSDLQPATSQRVVRLIRVRNGVHGSLRRDHPIRIGIDPPSPPNAGVSVADGGG